MSRDGISRYVVPGLIVAVTAVWLSLGHARDFMVYWRAGREMLHGSWSDVYQISVQAPFKYHPVFAMLFAPFGLLNERAAQICWAILNAALVFDVMRRWEKCWGLDAAAVGMGYLCIGHALFWQHDLGNVTFVMLWLWTVALTTRASWVRAAGYGLLIALKPFWLALLIAWVLARRWKLIAQVAASVIALSLLPVVLGPRQFAISYTRWIATFADQHHLRDYYSHANQSWYGEVLRQITDGPAAKAWWLGGCIAMGLLWLWSWRTVIGTAPDQDTAARMELSMAPLIIWAAPLSWIHHQILLWPLLALAWQLARREMPSRVVWLAELVLLTLVSESIIGRQATLSLLSLGVPLLGILLLNWWAPRRLSAQALRVP